MNSSETSERLNLGRDLPTTEEDVVAQRRLRTGPPVTLEEYFRFLASFEPLSYEQLRARRGPRGDTPFELIP